jgi:hypothetical protein
MLSPTACPRLEDALGPTELTGPSLEVFPEPHQTNRITTSSLMLPDSAMVVEAPIISITALIHPALGLLMTKTVIGKGTITGR